MCNSQNSYDFTDKKVWVTGAAGGVGMEIAKRFVELGADVIGFDVVFKAQNYPFRSVELDITQFDSVVLACHQQFMQAGGLDILVNAAGILTAGKIDKVDILDWQHSFNVNVFGVFYLLRQLIAHFKKQRSGAIVKISFNAAHVPRMNMGAYCAAKAALTSLSHCIGLELAKYGVRCNVVSPGSTATPMLRVLLADDEGDENLIQGKPLEYKLGIPLGKIAQPTEIANAVLFFLQIVACREHFCRQVKQGKS